MKTTLKLVLLYFAYQLLFGAALMGLSCVLPLSTTAQLAWSLLLSGAAMTVHLVKGGYVSLGHVLRPVGVTPLLCSLVCAAGAVLACNALSGLLPLPNWLEGDFAALSHSVAGIAGMALMAPWVEELLFRGAILPALSRGGASPWRGIVLSALVFGLIHVNPAQVLAAFLIGLALGWTAVCTRSLWPAIMAHVANNALSVTEILAGKEGKPMLDPATTPVETLTATLVIGLLMAIVAGRQLPRCIAAETEKEHNQNHL